MADKPVFTRSRKTAGTSKTVGRKPTVKKPKKAKKVTCRPSRRKALLPIKALPAIVSPEISKKIREVLLETAITDDTGADDIFTDIQDQDVEISPRKVTRANAPIKKDTSTLQTVFDLAEVDSPLVGTPKEVQTELDGLALRMQADPDDQDAFEKILTYIHKYLLGLVFKKYNFVKGYEESDIYQEALIALFKKAVPKFDPTRNMSFLNFAKMCINRHLITILHASKHRRKDMPINNSISLDHNPNSSGEEDDGSCSLSNIIPDEKTSSGPYKELSRKEAYDRTLDVLKASLSSFEVMILEEYLKEKSYEEIARCVSKRTGIKYNSKSCDNALLRIRHKSLEILRMEGNIENVPLLF